MGEIGVQGRPGPSGPEVGHKSDKFDLIFDYKPSWKKILFFYFNAKCGKLQIF